MSNHHLLQVSHIYSPETVAEAKKMYEEHMAKAGYGWKWETCKVKHIWLTRAEEQILERQKREP